VVAQALDGVRTCFARAGESRRLRLHGDCHAGNVLWISDGPQAGPHFVDFDDSRSGPAVQDLWMLLSGARDEMSRQLSDLLGGYEDFRDFDRRELHLVEALRTLRRSNAAWLAACWDDPAPPHFRGSTRSYWRDRISAASRSR
jgi:Ser/Thr protein kinase RdoA (MazF antagonist)